MARMPRSNSATIKDRPQLRVDVFVNPPSAHPKVSYKRLRLPLPRVKAGLPASREAPSPAELDSPSTSLTTPLGATPSITTTGLKRGRASGPKRVKNARITRNFVIGSEAWPLDDSNRPTDTPPDHTKGWKVYVKTVDNGPNLTAWLKKVQFKIYHTYGNPVRVIEEPPFEIQETGWGGFHVDIKLFFVPDASAKPEMRTHFLQLENYGDLEMQARQEREKMVRSEFMESIEFNEPTEGLYGILTGEEQWMRQKQGRGKGNGAKGKARATEVNTEGTVELPETGNFSKQSERDFIEIIKRKIEEVEVEKKAEDERMKAILARLEEVRQGATISIDNNSGSGDIDQVMVEV